MLCGHHAIDHLIHACANVRSPLQCVGTVANVVTVMPMAMKSTGVQSWACSAPHAACNRECASASSVAPRLRNTFASCMVFTMLFQRSSEISA
jgi:hypothetical protein